MAFFKERYEKDTKVVARLRVEVGGLEQVKL